MANMETMIARGFLSVDFTRLFTVIVAAPEKGFDE